MKNNTPEGFPSVEDTRAHLTNEQLCAQANETLKKIVLTIDYLLMLGEGGKDSDSNPLPDDAVALARKEAGDGLEALEKTYRNFTEPEYSADQSNAA